VLAHTNNCTPLKVEEEDVEGEDGGEERLEG